MILQLLLHLPLDQKFASDRPAECSLSLLNQLQRHAWLNSLILILYKYRFDAPPISELIPKLVRIVIATLECHCHLCDEGKERRPTEFAYWSDSSDEISGEKTIMEEDEEIHQQRSSDGSVPFMAKVRFKSIFPALKLAVC